MPTRYRHYKGGIYELVCEAVLEADHTPVIVYRGQDGVVWVRPRDAFFETVTVDGRILPRFTLLDATSA
ncbi:MULTISPECIES: DUF1653 domain-containing protein [Massilia]|uniref:DUF1653 domain-containing protein n=1 Tax=Massilia aurea TaxID=373040 RepID=A0A422QGR3_9BURK|nr:MULTISPECIES: DUF1653 domain-containing protein [Massilia]MDY0964402.1 DUF1653 domain-containing protein [Massilia sp. CFBP9026]RNF29156.1 hypothetical protein NM04_19335 [Massilia aurea]